MAEPSRSAIESREVSGGATHPSSWSAWTWGWRSPSEKRWDAGPAGEGVQEGRE